MPLLFIIGFFLWVWAELAMLVAIGGEVGVLLTIAGIFVTAMVGMWLLRTQGRMIMSTLKTQLARGEAPVASLAAGVSIMAGAVLMLIPGYITDGIGLVLFLPVIRTLVGAYLLQAITRRGHVMMRGGPFGGGPFGAGTSGDSPGGSSFGTRWSGMGGQARPDNENGFRRNTSHDDDVIEGDFEERHPDRDKIDKP